jgi:hypothetical protein
MSVMLTDLLAICRGRVPGHSIECESLDTKCIAFRMSSLWEIAIERETIVKLNGSF